MGRPAVLLLRVEGSAGKARTQKAASLGTSLPVEAGVCWGPEFCLILRERKGEGER